MSLISCSHLVIVYEIFVHTCGVICDCMCKSFCEFYSFTFSYINFWLLTKRQTQKRLYGNDTVLCVCTGKEQWCFFPHFEASSECCHPTQQHAVFEINILWLYFWLHFNVYNKTQDNLEPANISFFSVVREVNAIIHLPLS